ncbi:MerR family transcriptional regulator [Faecalicatena contorta]|uniref:MerR family transcriptional regulator n=1 Tax=Faecalicatena fissicatena TaxID=290055 RepID=A0ABS2E5Q3_9FIRM|nr:MULTISPECIES: MerR family transcriptional regulator [Clostridia]MBM6684599.1 MerR family transcriptional regulator [Faecalicatena contorta]MBM6709857.1 MerR family transcriptional regulator [Faecalicatena contorta]MBM6736940.1 MerR family transcriptional regulator [Faecalicatena fissicatena]HIX99285.1 MerR family transcriptional regulator [Candidatus Dorea intestinigallinarum]
MSEKTIGTLSKFTGIPAHTIKYYEKIGLLSSNRKESSNYRSYDMRICTDIYECVKYRNMGFPLKETKELVKEAGDRRLDELLDERESQIEEEIRALTEQKRRLEIFRREIRELEGRLGKWYIEECGDFYFRSQTKELDYDGGDYLEADGLNLSTLLPVSKTTVHMEREYLRGEKRGYSWGMGIFPGEDREWIREKKGYRYVPAGRAFVIYLKITGPYVSDGTMAEEIGRYYRLLWPGTPSEAFGIRLKITFDENGNDWNYFKIFIPLEEK